ncbi:MAG TPA: hypothetical protein VGO93_03160 [Candidatus Xenobia bacterium]|jgi:hypothetical protein
MSTIAVGPQVAAPIQRPNGVAAADAPEAVTTRKSLDVSKLPFKITMEVKSSDAAALNRVLAGTGWSAAPAPSDCSHNSEGCWNSGYCRVDSPSLTLADGGLAAVTTTLDKLGKVFKTPGNTAAMRFVLPDSALDDEGVTHLVNMHLANESIIYRLGNSGGPGRAMRDKMQWACPFSTKSCYIAEEGHQHYYDKGVYWYRWDGMRTVQNKQSVADWRKQLSNRHWGMNASQQGFWEFRYFDSSFDGPAVGASLQMLLGMVKAAAEGRGQWDQVRPLPTTMDQEVSRKQWNAFVDTVAPEHKAQLEKNFIGAGGKLEKQALTPAGQTATGSLIAQGYKFTAGSEAMTLKTLMQRLEKNEPVGIVEPGSSSPVTLAAQLVEPYVLLQTASAEAPAALRQDAAQAAAAQMAGVRFATPDHVGISPCLAVLQPKVLAQKNGREVWVGDGGLSLSELVAVELDKGLPQDLYSIFNTLKTIHADGYRPFNTTELTWPAEIASAYRTGSLSVRRDGQSVAVPSVKAMEKDVLVPLEVARLSPADRTLYERAQTLTTKGFAFGKEKPGTVAFLKQLTSPSADLTVQIPGAKNATPVPTRALLSLLVNIETGHTEDVDKTSRRHIELIDALAGHGYKFFNLKTEDEIQSRSGAALTLQTPDHHLTMRAPGGERRVPVNETALSNLLALEQGKRDQMQPELRRAVELHEKLTPGTWVQMADIMDKTQFVNCSPAELVANLVAEREVGLLNSSCGAADKKPNVARTVSVGADAFNRAAEKRLAGLALSDDQEAAMHGLFGLVDAHRMQATSNTGARPMSQAMMPWLMADHVPITVSASSETEAIQSWDDVKTLVANETAAAGHEGDANLIALLKHSNVQFYTAQATKTTPALALTTSVRKAMAGDGAVARVPKLMFWGSPIPTKKVVVKTTADLEKLSQKLKV